MTRTLVGLAAFILSAAAASARADGPACGAAATAPCEQPKRCLVSVTKEVVSRSRESVHDCLSSHGPQLRDWLTYRPLYRSRCCWGCQCNPICTPPLFAFFVHKCDTAPGADTACRNGGCR